MANELPSMRAADVEVKGLSDGILKTSLDRVIGMERGQAETLVGGTDNGSLYIPVNNFLVRRGEKIILIDAGAGHTMQPTLGRLPDNLRAAGVEPTTITHIVITHLHPDHANGLVDDSGKPNYPNAEIVVHETEADFWLRPATANDPEKVQGNRARTKINLAPYLQQIRRVRDGEEYVGFTPVLAPGHTPGHTCWLLAAKAGGFLALGDLVHLSAIQISHPDVALNYDLDKDRAVASRKRILDMAASERLAIAGAHVNAPGFGYVVRKGASYAFEPHA
ncbi:MAG TPA: MBL fold metallo-hydrolase [Xanthobacteraceae bacterium]|jgi:glyoxylase-like metal-dependent hydrolase (beta-lactamase superfamily II)